MTDRTLYDWFVTGGQNSPHRRLSAALDEAGFHDGGTPRRATTAFNHAISEDDYHVVITTTRDNRSVTFRMADLKAAFEEGKAETGISELVGEFVEAGSPRVRKA